MIRRIAIRGYKSLQDVDLRLDPLTIVIGPNAAGKSNLLDAIGLLSRTVAGDLQSAFTEHRGDPLRSFTFDERGIDGLLSREEASFCIEVDIELSESTLDRVNGTITEAREGHEPARALVRERFLRYSVHVRIRTDSGVLQVIDESLLALNRDLERNQRRNPFLSSVESRGGQKRLSLRLERQSHPFEYDLGMDRTVVSLPLYAPHHPHVVAVRHELASWRTYYLEPEAMRRDSSLREVQRLPHDGSDLAGFYNTLEKEYPLVFDAMNRALRGVTARDRAGGSLDDRLRALRLYIIERGVRFEASALSRGRFGHSGADRHHELSDSRIRHRLRGAGERRASRPPLMDRDAIPGSVPQRHDTIHHQHPLSAVSGNVLARRVARTSLLQEQRRCHRVRHD